MKKCNCFVCLLLMCIVIAIGCNGDDSLGGTEEKPSDFPTFMEPLPNANNVRYATPANAAIVPDTYNLSYFVTEEFPPEKSMQAISQDLAAHGYIRAKYLLLASPQVEADYIWQMVTIQGAEFLNWTEEWIHTQKDDSVHVVYSFRYVPQEKTQAKLFISMSYRTTKSEFAGLVARYKQSYSKEEWEKNEEEIDYNRSWRTSF